MTGRERVLKALSFQPTDRVPMDLGGMDSTGISCFAYPALVEALGLPPRPTRVHDTGQMLAFPDTDVLDALDCDVITVRMDMHNAFPQQDLWHPYDFNGRLPALVRDPSLFETLEDGTIVQPLDGRQMPPTSHVFEAEHGGQPLLLTGDIPKPDLDEVKASQEKSRLLDKDLKAVRENCRRAREVSDRAILFNGPGAGIGIANFTGIAMFPMLCLTEPGYVAELHDIVTRYAVERIEALLPEVAPYIDLYMCSADDWGTQNQTIAAPQVYRDLFKPYYRRITGTIHALAPEVKTFLHSCGAIYDLLDDIVDSGFDALNPVQWTAGGHSCREWKDKCRNRLALWGGGVNTQDTLPLGTVDDVHREVAEVVRCLSQDGGYVFCGIHNLLAEIPGEKIIAMYETARTLRA
jgi:uroporphyrinogen decarboxylase